MGCDHKKIFREMVRVLRKLPAPPKYKRVSHKEKDKKQANKYNKHYIKFQCGTHSMVISDKTYQAIEQGLQVDYGDLPEGVLRFEVQYQRSAPRGLEKKMGTDNPSELLWVLMQESEKRIGKALWTVRFSIAWSRVIPDGDGEINQKGVDFYRDLIAICLANGIVPIVTLYHYDMPMALVEKYDGWIGRQSVKDFERYARFVIETFQDKVKYWLTINEQSIIVQFWDRTNIVRDERKGNDQLRFQMHHHGRKNVASWKTNI